MKCNLCGGAVPVFHSFPKKALFNKPLRAALPQATVRMDLGYCGTCRHVSSVHTGASKSADLEKKIYEDLYESFTETTFSPSQEKYTNFVASFLLSWLPKKKQRVLEIGCHDGYLLDLIHKKGHNVVGVEPSPFAEMCQKRYPFEVQKGFFDPAKFPKASFDLIVARHVLEHVKDPGEFMRGISSLLKKGGMAYIEVPNSFLSLEQSYFPEFHVDHISYFTSASLTGLLGQVGLREQLHVESIYAYMKFPFVGALVRKNPAATLVRSQLHYLDYAMPGVLKNFVESYRRYESNIKTIARGRRLAVWGSGSLGTQFAIDAGWSRKAVHYVDPNKSNQQKVLSVTGHLVESPDILNKSRFDAVLMASGWENDVKRQIQAIVKYKVDLISVSDLIHRS